MKITECISRVLEQRLAENGWAGLEPVELLTCLLLPGNSAQRARSQAGRLWESLTSLRLFKSATYTDLVEAGLDPERALSFLAGREILRRSKIRFLPLDRPFHSSAEVFRYFRPIMQDLQKECFWVLLMDGKNRVRRVQRVSEGSLTRTIVHPREVFRPAVREAAAGLLFVHNHPSGVPDPSQEDLQITQRLVKTGEVLGIRVLDHVIIGSYRYFSFADQGMLRGSGDG